MSTEPHGPHTSLDLEDHDRGLRFDRIVLGRRRVLAFAGGAGVAALLAACGSKSSGSGTTEGVPMTIDLTLTDASSGEALSGAAVYLWHADRDGKYSLYSQGVTDQNYLRGVQPAGEDGSLSFRSIFPACYDGRWPHIHFEVYASVDDAVGGGEPLATSQIALPQDICDTVYATEGYEQSLTNLSRVTLASDNVFSDGVALQTPTVSGDVAGVAISLPVGV